MAYFRLKLRNNTKKKLECLLQSARKNGRHNLVKRILAILAINRTYTYRATSEILHVCEESIRLWVIQFILKGIAGITPRKRSGRPPKLTKTQKKELEKIIEEGPHKADFPGACWRSPMIQELIYEKFGAFYSVNYIAQLLKNMGFSYQKAKFVSGDKDSEKRKEWLERVWPEILKLSKNKKAYILFGDEASFPQWGTLTYTWARKGCQPVVKTSGKRKGYKVLGLIDYFTGRFFHKCHEGRLNSKIYQEYLLEVMKKTRKHILLIQDGAKYHTSVSMKEFFAKYSARITVYQLPSYSPDFNPIEKLWKKIKEKGTHLHYFPTFDSLKSKVNEGLVYFENSKREVLTLFGFYKRMAA